VYLGGVFADMVFSYLRDGMIFFDRYEEMGIKL